MPPTPGIKVLLVRHAQSQNNIVQASVQAKIKAGTAPHQAQVGFPRHLVPWSSPACSGHPWDAVPRKEKGCLPSVFLARALHVRIDEHSRTPILPTTSPTLYCDSPLKSARPNGCRTVRMIPT